MISFHTRLKCIDNSGAKIVQCIKILKGSKPKHARIGDLIVTSVKKAETKSNAVNKVKKGQVCRAIITGCKKEKQRPNGSLISFSNNTAVLLNSNNIPLGTRIFGPIPAEVNKKKFSKLYTIVPYKV